MVINGTIITDCIDPEAQGRQSTRFSRYFGSRPKIISVENPHADLQAAGKLISVLDNINCIPLNSNEPHIVLVNVAPRGDEIKKKHDNGTPFCYFRSGHALVVSNYEGRTLALARDMDILSKVELLNIPDIADELKKQNIIANLQAERLKHTQFRSLEFLPLAALLLLKGIDIPSKTVSITKSTHPGIENTIWYEDNFGNLKTTIAADSSSSEKLRKQLAKKLNIASYERLADVPTGKLAVIRGSSGYGDDIVAPDRRFLEIVKQNGDAAEALSISVGQSL